jgi:hypothetical protein
MDLQFAELRFAVFTVSSTEYNRISSVPLFPVTASTSVIEIFDGQGTVHERFYYKLPGNRNLMKCTTLYSDYICTFYFSLSRPEIYIL